MNDSRHWFYLGVPTLLAALALMISGHASAGFPILGAAVAGLLVGVFRLVRERRRPQ